MPPASTRLLAGVLSIRSASNTAKRIDSELKALSRRCSRLYDVSTKRLEMWPWDKFTHRTVQ